MKIKDIIQDAGKLLGLDAPKNSANWSILFRCANLAVSNVASNYKDCITEQTFNVTDTIITFDQFNKPFLKVKSIKSGGTEVNYELYIDFLVVPNGKIKVQYACVPKFVSNDDDISIIGGIMNEGILLYGIMAEYAYISGLVDEVKLYNDKFEQLLFGMHKSGKTRVMP